MDKTQLAGELLMLSGALHDIAEKSKEHYTQKQINDIRERLEKLVSKYFRD